MIFLFVDVPAPFFIFQFWPPGRVGFSRARVLKEKKLVLKKSVTLLEIKRVH